MRRWMCLFSCFRGSSSSRPATASDASAASTPLSEDRRRKFSVGFESLVTLLEWNMSELVAVLRQQDQELKGVSPHVEWTSRQEFCELLKVTPEHTDKQIEQKLRERLAELSEDKAVALVRAATAEVRSHRLAGRPAHLASR